MIKTVTIGVLISVAMVFVLGGSIYRQAVKPFLNSNNNVSISTQRSEDEIVQSRDLNPSSALDRALSALVTLRDLALSPLEESMRQIITPGPLDQLAIVGSIGYETPLTRAGVIAVTNEERLRADLPALTENSKLNEAARLRLEDMFKKEYFAHNSPSGEGVAAAAEVAGYGYIVVGENLALGGFKNDQAVVRAWMESPGHKANLLARRYSDIGVAVGEGNFKGKRARLAVQVFGTPLSACPAPREALRIQIYANKERLDTLEPILVQLKKDLDEKRVSSLGLSSQIKEYNRRAVEFNALIQTTQAAIIQYNDQVRIFNNCASSK